jgi:hypothetical protein
LLSVCVTKAIARQEQIEAEVIALPVPSVIKRIFKSWTFVWVIAGECSEA